MLIYVNYTSIKKKLLKKEATLLLQHNGKKTVPSPLENKRDLLQLTTVKGISMKFPP